jgi:hypothetical protein
MDDLVRLNLVPARYGGSQADFPGHPGSGPPAGIQLCSAKKLPIGSNDVVINDVFVPAHRDVFVPAHRVVRMADIYTGTAPGADTWHA